MGGSGDVDIDVTFPWYFSVQLPFVYFNVSTILVPSGLVADLAGGARYHIISLFNTSLLEQGPQIWPNVSYLRVLDKSCHSEP